MVKNASAMVRNDGTQAPRQPPHSRRIRTGTRAHGACVNCKEKKLKCDDQVPACANCQRLGSLCVVEDRRTKQLQPRNYTDALEKRVAFLENLLQQTHQNSAIISPPTDQAFLHRPEPGFSPPISIPVLSSNGVDYIHESTINSKSNEMNELASNVGALSINAAGAEPRYLGTSSIFAFSRVISSSLRQVVLKPLSNRDEQLDANCYMPKPCSLPDPKCATKLSDSYFENIHPQYPFLHEPTFRAWETAFVTRSQDSAGMNSYSAPLFFLNMVYAIGAILLRKSDNLPERLYASAMLHIDDILRSDGLDAIQAILCCSVYSLRSSTGASHWKLAGLALRQCIDLGYHRNSVLLKSAAGSLQIELQKRAFWCSYTMENAAAVMLGRPISLPDEEVDVEYPDIIDDWSSTEGALASLTKPTVAMSMAVHGFRYRRLLGRIHTSLYSKRALADVTGNSAAVSIELLRTELETWKASTPSLVPLSGQALSFFTTKDGFDTDYYYAILLLYRVQIIKSNEASRSAFFNCLQAAENILHAYRDQFIGRPTCYTWVALYEIILAGLTYLHCIWTSPDIRQTTRPDQVSSVCTDCTVVLVVMAEKWAAAAPYRDIFEALANRTMTMITDARYGESGLPSVFTESVDPDVETLMQWRTDIPHTGISDEIDSLLACLVGDQPSGMQAGNNEESYDGDHLRNSHIWN